MKISACLITKNEEKCLERCLASLNKYVDEIIVVDTGSIDGTKAIAKKYQVKLYDYSWQNDFAAAKNFAKSKAVGEWIIFPDADEYFATNCLKSIRKIIKANEQICDAFMVRMINIDEDKNNEYIDEFYTMRIFKNIPELQFKNAIHEELANITGAKTRLYKLDKSILMYHTGYSSKKIAAKCERNLKVLLKELDGTVDDKYRYRYIADAYLGIADYANALKYARLDIVTGKKELAYASRSYRIVNICLRELKAESAEREVAYKDAIIAFNDLPDFYGEYGYYLYSIDKYNEALKYINIALSKAVEYSGMETSTFDNNLINYYVILGNISYYKNNCAAAMEYYNKAINIDHLYIPAFFVWAKCLIRRYPMEQVIEKIKAHYSIKEYQFIVDNIALITKAGVYQYFLQAIGINAKHDYEKLKRENEFINKMLNKLKEEQ